MKKLNLKLDPAQEPGMVLIGVSSHENDYKLVWAINNSMKFKFVRISNLSYDNPRNEGFAEFSRFLFDDTDRYIKYLMVSNKSEGDTLFPEIKNIDYLIHVHGELIGRAVSDLVRTLKNLDVITGAYLLDTAKLKGTDRLLMD